MIYSPSSYRLYPEFNPYNKKYREQSIKKYLSYAYPCKWVYVEREGGKEVAEQKIVNYFGYKGFKYLHKETKVDGEKIDSQAMCYWNNEEFAVTFAGTNDFSDWILNVKLSTIKVLGFEFHLGFYLYFKSLWKDIYKLYLKHGKGKALTISGHSLGGASAGICAAFFYFQKKVMPFQVVTFGQPRWAESGYAEIISNYFNQNYYRFTFSNDAVPGVPRRYMGYRHLKVIHCHIKSNGRFSNKAVFLSRMWGRTKGIMSIRPFVGITHHDMTESYIRKVQKKYKVYL